MIKQRNLYSLHTANCILSITISNEWYPWNMHTLFGQVAMIVEIYSDRGIIYLFIAGGIYLSRLKLIIAQHNRSVLWEL